MDVHLISTTDAWAQIAIAGPNSRKIISKIVDSGSTFPMKISPSWHAKN